MKTIKPNILISELPTVINYDGRQFNINPSFRIMLTYALIMDEYSKRNFKSDNEIIEYLDSVGFLSLVINRFFLDGEAIGINHYFNMLQGFYSGWTPYVNHASSTQKKRKKDFCYYVDQDLIFAMFRERYNINLAREDLHWFEFKSLLLGGLGLTLQDVIAYRQCDISKIKDNKEKERIKTLKNIYSLEDTYTEQEILYTEQYYAELNKRINSALKRK